MSLKYNNPSGYDGVIQLIERNLGFNPGDISNNAILLAQFTAEINLTVSEMLGFLYPLGGSWQLDDSNQSGDPILTANLVSGQRDYHFTTDTDGNVILDFERVLAKGPSGVFQELRAVDQQTADTNSSDTRGFYDGQNATGTPTKYDKTGNGIFLDPIPSYDSTGGLKIFINREAVSFTTADTTKKLGFMHSFHEYLALRPSYIYARNHGLASAVGLQNDMLRMQEAMKLAHGSREKDVKRQLKPNVENNR